MRVPRALVDTQTPTVKRVSIPAAAAAAAAVTGAAAALPLPLRLLLLLPPSCIGAASALLHADVVPPATAPAMVAVSRLAQFSALAGHEAPTSRRWPCGTGGSRRQT